MRARQASSHRRHASAQILTAMADDVVRPHDVLADGLRDDLIDAIKDA